MAYNIDLMVDNSVHYTGLYERWPTFGSSGNRQDVRLFFNNIRVIYNIFIYLNIYFRRHIPTIVVQGRYDVVCPVRVQKNKSLCSCMKDH